MSKRPLTPMYVFFYLLFAPDTWRVLIGLAFAAWLTPSLIKPDMPSASPYVLFLMLGSIGWAVSAVPGKWIAGKLRGLVPK